MDDQAGCLRLQAFFSIRCRGLISPLGIHVGSGMGSGVAVMREVV